MDLEDLGPRGIVSLKEFLEKLLAQEAGLGVTVEFKPLGVTGDKEGRLARILAMAASTFSTSTTTKLEDSGKNSGRKSRLQVCESTVYR